MSIEKREIKINKIKEIPRSIQKSRKSKYQDLLLKLKDGDSFDLKTRIESRSFQSSLNYLFKRDKINLKAIVRCVSDDKDKGKFNPNWIYRIFIIDVERHRKMKELIRDSLVYGQDNET